MLIKRALRCLFLSALLISLLPFNRYAQDLATGESEENPVTTSASQNAPITLLVARPTGNTEFSWLAPLVHEFVLFRLGAVTDIRIVNPDSLLTAIPGYRSYTSGVVSQSSYLDKADAFSATHLLLTSFKVQKNNAIQFSMVVVPVKDQTTTTSVQSSASEAAKIDEGLDACFSQLLSGLSLEPTPAVQKFLKTRISGNGSCDKTIGNAVVASYSDKKQNLKGTADELKKCGEQNEGAYLASYLAARYTAKAGEYEKAATILKDLIFKLGPVDASLYPLCSYYFRKAEKLENALQMVKVGEGLKLGTNELVLEKAFLLEAMDEENDAATAWREVLTFDASNFNALLFLMQKSNKDKDATAAIDFANRFRQAYPGDGRGDLEAGRAYLAVQQYPDAQAALTKATDILTANAEPLILLGDVFSAQYNYTAALDQYERAVELTADNVDLDVKIAHTCLLMGKPEMAVETLKKIQKKHYDNPGLQKILGLAEYQTGDTAAAQRDLNRYTQNGAPDHDVFFTLGEIYDNAGEYAEALDSYERAAALDQTDQVSPQRIAAVKQKMTGNEYADKVKKKKEKRETAERGKHLSPRVTISILSGIAGIGAFGGGYLMDMLMKKDYNVYKDYNNKTDLDARTTQRVADLRKSIDQKILYRNVLYSVTGLCVAGVTLTIVIP